VGQCKSAHSYPLARNVAGRHRLPYMQLAERWGSIPLPSTNKTWSRNSGAECQFEKLEVEISKFSVTTKRQACFRRKAYIPRGVGLFAFRYILCDIGHIASCSFHWYHSNPMNQLDVICIILITILAMPYVLFLGVGPMFTGRGYIKINTWWWGAIILFSQWVVLTCALSLGGAI
jgi:hypothetical protein